MHAMCVYLHDNALTRTCLSTRSRVHAIIEDTHLCTCVCTPIHVHACAVHLHLNKKVCAT